MTRPFLLAALLLAGLRSPSVDDRPPCPAAPTARSHALIEIACKDVRDALRRVPGAAVRTARTAFVDERFDCSRRGCVVTLRGSFRKLKDQESADVWLGGYLEQRGWIRTSSHDADGPDGTVYALHQPGALCIVEGRWSHWDDDRGDHTADDYRVTVSCGDAEDRPPS